MGRKKRTFQKLHAIPMIQAQRLATEMGAAEASQERSPFSLCWELRENPRCNGKVRDAALRRAWRWALRRTIAHRHHLEIVLMRAAIAEKLGTQPNARPKLVRAHRRLQVLYFRGEEYELSRLHASYVMELSEGVIKRDPLVLGADFWRMCAKADVEIARTDFSLLEPPFVADEGAAAVELAKAEAAAKRHAIQHTLVAKRKQAEAAKRAVERKAAKIRAGKG